MISKKHSINSVINRFVIYVAIFLLAILILLSYFWLEDNSKRDAVIFQNHVQHLAETISYNNNRQMNVDLTGFLDSVGTLGNYYEITNQAGRIISRVGTNEGDVQFSVNIENTDWMLLSRKNVAPLFERLQPIMINMAIIFIGGIALLYFLGRKTTSLFKDDFKQMSKAIDFEPDSEESSSKPINILLTDFQELYERIQDMIINVQDEATEYIKDEAKSINDETISIKDKAIRDSFTQLLNEDAFNESKQKFFKMASGDIKSALILIDIDKLDLMNQNYGLEIGDLAIRGISDILLTSVRDSDESFYLGNGRFAVVMIDAQSAELLKWYESLMRRFDALEQSLREPDHPSLQLSISAGAAKVGKADNSFDATLQRCESVLSSVKLQSPGIIVMARDPNSEFPEYETE